MTRPQLIRILAGALLCVAFAAGAQNPSADGSSGLTSAKGGEQFTLNFKNAEMQALIATVSELTGRNFVVDRGSRAR